MRTCPNCSTSIQDDAQFCSRCGAIVQPAIPGTSPAPGSFPPQTSIDAPTSEKATASLIFGILSYIILPLIGAIPAIILGHLALSEIRKSAGRLKGHGMAVGGMVLGYVQFAFIPFILIIAAIAIPNLLRARMAAN